jgi:hypothetical protein
MEVPGRDVTADALGPDTETPRTEGAPPEATRPGAAAPDEDDREGLGEKVRDVAEKVKDAVTPDRDKP